MVWSRLKNTHPLPPFTFLRRKFVFGGHCLQCLKTYVLSIRLVTIRLPTFRFTYPSILNANTCLLAARFHSQCLNLLTLRRSRLSHKTRYWALTQGPHSNAISKNVGRVGGYYIFNYYKFWFKTTGCVNQNL